MALRQGMPAVWQIDEEIGRLCRYDSVETIMELVRYGPTVVNISGPQPDDPVASFLTSEAMGVHVILTPRNAFVHLDGELVIIAGTTLGTWKRLWDEFKSGVAVVSRNAQIELGLASEWN